VKWPKSGSLSRFDIRLIDGWPVETRELLSYFHLHPSRWSI
jgi:hypothetical protein